MVQLLLMVISIIRISMRPEFNYRNWGMGFDFYLYIDANGKLYDETWKFNNAKMLIEPFLINLDILDMDILVTNYILE